MKLLIAIPSLDYMHAEFVKSLLALVRKLRNDGVAFDVDIQTGTLVYVARDGLAKRAINEGFTHVLWLDSDMVFTEDLLEDLMFSGKDFVTGICHSRRKPFLSCVFKKMQPPDRYDPDEYPNDTFEIDGCGMACCLVKVDILRDVCLNNSGTCYCPLPLYGEDLAFCKRAHDLGYKIYAEPTVRVGHIGHITIYPEDMKRWMTEISNAGDFFNV